MCSFIKLAFFFLFNVVTQLTILQKFTCQIWFNFFTNLFPISFFKKESGFCFKTCFLFLQICFKYYKVYIFNSHTVLSKKTIVTLFNLFPVLFYQRNQVLYFLYTNKLCKSKPKTKRQGYHLTLQNLYITNAIFSVCFKTVLFYSAYVTYVFKFITACRYVLIYVSHIKQLICFYTFMDSKTSEVIMHILVLFTNRICYSTILCEYFIIASHNNK